MEKLKSAFLRLINLFIQALRQFNIEILSDKELSDGRQKVWDVRLKLLAGLGVVIGAWWAVHSSRVSAEQEARKNFWDKQVGLYFEAAEEASEIANLADDDSDRKTAIAKFWNLYYGPLRVVEDDATVGAAMVDFGRCIPQPGRTLAEDTACASDKREMQHRSLALAVSCRNSIAENWDRKLSGLKRGL